MKDAAITLLTELPWLLPSAQGSRGCQELVRASGVGLGCTLLTAIPLEDRGHRHK